MPLPIAHSIAGYVCYEIKPGSFSLFKKKWMDLLFMVFVANLPDIDFLPGFILGTPHMFHGSVTHTLGGAVLLGLAGAYFFSRKKGNFLFYFMLISLTYYSHILLDFFGEDLRPPIGVRMFWPVIDGHFLSPISVFYRTIRMNDSLYFFQSLFCLTNFKEAINEIFIMGSLSCTVKLLKIHYSKKNKVLNGSSEELA